MSRIIVDAIRNSSASSDGITLSSDGKVTFPNTSTGKLLQVKTTTKTDHFTSTSASWVDITGLSVDMTLSNSSNKILMRYDVMVGANFWNLGPAFLSFSCLLYTSPSPRD